MRRYLIFLLTLTACENVEKDSETPLSGQVVDDTGSQNAEEDDTGSNSEQENLDSDSDGLSDTVEETEVGTDPKAGAAA